MILKTGRIRWDVSRDRQKVHLTEFRQLTSNDSYTALPGSVGEAQAQYTGGVVAAFRWERLAVDRYGLGKIKGVGSL
jgi:hypothetical protein